MSVWPVKLSTWQFYLEAKSYKVNIRHRAPTENSFMVGFLFCTVTLNWNKTIHRKWGGGLWDVSRQQRGEERLRSLLPITHDPRHLRQSRWCRAGPSCAQELTFVGYRTHQILRVWNLTSYSLLKPNRNMALGGMIRGLKYLSKVKIRSVISNQQS